MVADKAEGGQPESAPASPPAKPLARLLVKRLAIFFLVISAAALFLWVAGNFRDFLDATQLLLLAVIRYSSLALALSSALGLGIFLGFGGIEGPLLRRMRDYALGVSGYLLLLALGTGLALVSEALFVLTQGLR